MLVKRGRVRRDGAGQSFWFRPLSVAISEVPVDDREPAAAGARPHRRLPGPHGAGDRHLPVRAARAGREPPRLRHRPRHRPLDRHAARAGGARRHRASPAGTSWTSCRGRTCRPR
nr:hypothetical protein [Angustibacter aerolatus]